MARFQGIKEWAEEPIKPVTFRLVKRSEMAFATSVLMFAILALYGIHAQGISPVIMRDWLLAMTVFAGMSMSFTLVVRQMLYRKSNIRR